MSKDIRRTVLNFFEEKGVYDLFGREPGKLTYNDVVDLTDRLLESEEFVDSKETKETIEGLQDDLDTANASSEDYYEKLNDAEYELGKLIDNLCESEYLAESGLVRKLKEIRADMEM